MIYLSKEVAAKQEFSVVRKIANKEVILKDCLDRGRESIFHFPPCWRTVRWYSTRRFVACDLVERGKEERRLTES